MPISSRLELVAKLEFLRKLVIETREGKHDATIKASREEVCKSLEEYISQGERLYRDWTEVEAANN